MPLVDPEPLLTRERDDRISRDAVEDVAERRSDQRTVDHGEEVRGGRLGDVTVAIEKNDLVEPGVERATASDHRSQVRGRDLGQGRDRIGRGLAHVTRDLNGETRRSRVLLGEVGARVGRDDDAHLGRARHDVGLDRRDEPRDADEPVPKARRRDRAAGGRAQRFGAERRREADEGERAEEPRDVLAEPEHRDSPRGVVERQDVEHQRSTLHGVRERRDRRRLPGHELAIAPDHPIHRQLFAGAGAAVKWVPARP